MSVSIVRVLLVFVGVLAAVPVSAQIDLTGTWANQYHDDLEGENLGDYSGLPINDEARARADAWMVSYLAMPERQCIMFTSHYLIRGPQNIEIRSEVDPISGRMTALTMSGAIDRVPRRIWLDGRPHPPAAALHTPDGFSTGEWQGDTLVVTTTHLTEGILGRQGVPSSDQATIREYILRHGERLTIAMILHDPVYLDEPHFRSLTFRYNPAVRVLPEPCEPVTELVRPPGEVPHHLPGTNPYLEDMAKKYGIPSEGLRGGAATLYPEYRKRLRSLTERE